MVSSVVAKLKSSEKPAIFQVSYEDYEKFKKNLGTSCSYLSHYSSSQCQSKQKKKSLVFLIETLSVHSDDFNQYPNSSLLGDRRQLSAVMHTSS